MFICRCTIILFLVIMKIMRCLNFLESLKTDKKMVLILGLEIYFIFIERIILNFFLMFFSIILVELNCIVFIIKCGDIEI